jgi:hypothetical protein
MMADSFCLFHLYGLMVILRKVRKVSWLLQQIELEVKTIFRWRKLILMPRELLPPMRDYLNLQRKNHVRLRVRLQIHCHLEIGRPPAIPLSLLQRMAQSFCRFGQMLFHLTPQHEKRAGLHLLK